VIDAAEQVTPAPLAPQLTEVLAAVGEVVL
jgi:hypothetical protein